MKTIKNEKSGAAPRQVLYISILISLTIGFVAGSAYTSFKLADGVPGNRVHTQPAQAPGSGSPGMTQDNPSPEMAARLAELEASVQQHPEDARTWATLGHVYFDLNQPDKAIQAYEKSLALAPEDPAVLTDLGVMYRRSGEPDKAIRAFDRAVSASPGFETALFNKGVVLMADLNDLEGAMAAWKELVKVNPDATTPGGEKVADIVARMASQK